MSYVTAADQYSWPRGRIFVENTIPAFTSLASIALVIGMSVALFMKGKVGFSWILWMVAAYFVGGAIITHVFRKHSGWLSLGMAPLLAIAGLLAV